jgi:hypothetical protein
VVTVDALPPEFKTADAAALELFQYWYVLYFKIHEMKLIFLVFFFVLFFSVYLS